ncbi:glycosyl transferase [Mycobacterium sp. djl-10]|nr:glycosyl transferase [Mycobacterium sp. djl-10]
MSNVVNIWHGTAVAERPRVSVVIPAMNEERNLPYVADRMPPDVDEIVFIDGNSADRTAEVAKQLWPRAIHLSQTRRGKGNALTCGFTAATGDIIVMLDADGSTDPAEIPSYVRALMDGADFAKGSRFQQGGGSEDITTVRRWGNRCLNGLVNLLFGASFTDLCYGYNAFWRRCLDHMDLPNITAAEPQWGDGFEIETLVNVRVAAGGLAITEVSSFESNRIHGVSHLHAVRDGLRVLRTISQEFARVRRAGARGRPPAELPIAHPRPA